MWMKEKGEGRPGSTQTREEDGFQDMEAASVTSDQGDGVIAFVGKGVEFKGIITYNGTVRIDGHLDGEIHTEGILLVGDDATISAKISAGTVISKGKITGDIIAKEKVRLLAPAVLNGSVKAPMLSMEEGVLFNGNCEMARAEVRELTRESSVRSIPPGAQGMKRISG